MVLVKNGDLIRVNHFVHHFVLLFLGSFSFHTRGICSYTWILKYKARGVCADEQDCTFSLVRRAAVMQHWFGEVRLHMLEYNVSNSLQAATSPGQGGVCL